MFWRVDVLGYIKIIVIVTKENGIIISIILPDINQYKRCCGLLADADAGKYNG